MHPVVYAADVGSIAQSHFGWARVDFENAEVDVERDRGGSEIFHLLDALERDLQREQPVALGFECPLFVPVPAESHQLGKARAGEESRSFSAGAGTGALVTGLVQMAWVLRELRQRRPNDVAFLDWNAYAGAGRGLFLWEAFVSGTGKGTNHVDDARIAATAFSGALPNPVAANAITAPQPLSLIGAALLWSGWSQDLSLLHEPCLVIKATPAAPLKRPMGKAAHRAKSTPQSTVKQPAARLHDWVVRVAEQIPRGQWTSYGDIAAIISEDPDSPFKPGGLSVGNELAKDPAIPNAHRILGTEGKIAGGYPYPRDLLGDEGVRFTNGRADRSQRWPTPPP